MEVGDKKYGIGNRVHTTQHKRHSNQHTADTADTALTGPRVLPANHRTALDVHPQGIRTEGDRYGQETQSVHL
jgi:hypothetical protein